MEGVLLCLPPAQKDGSERAGASFSSGLGDLTLSGFLPPSQSEPEGFSHFHLYVCAAFLIKWRKEILDEEDFQGLLMLLQNLPTIHWGNEEIGLLLAEAYRLKYMFADAPNHYRR